MAPEAGVAAPVLAPSAARARASGAARAEEGFWVAVLPFKYGGANADLTALAEGLSEEIVTGLSRFSYLRVIARSSTSRYANEAVDVAFRGQGARRALRDGGELCGRRERSCASRCSSWTPSPAPISGPRPTSAPFSPEAAFELQDDLVPRIVSMVAGMNGVLPRSMSEAVRSRTARAVDPLRGRAAQLRLLRAGHRRGARRGALGLELAVERRRPMPMPGRCWRCSASRTTGRGSTFRPILWRAASTAARRAVEAAPSSPLAHFSLAQALFFQKEFQGFRNAAERAVALNPMDGNSIAFLGELLTYAGDAERGLALAERAKQLNPHHPGWYWYADFYDAYRRGDDRGALECRAQGQHAGPLACARGDGRRLRAARGA